MERTDLNEKYEFRTIRQEEAPQAAEIEQICFPPNEACTGEMMFRRVQAAPDFFLVAVNRQDGRLAGFLNGLVTDEPAFRDEFFTGSGLDNPSGANVMILGLDVLPEHRGQGLARELMHRYVEIERARGRKKLILTCLPDKIKMYEGMGFRDNGIANSSWGGEVWHEMERAL